MQVAPPIERDHSKALETRANALACQEDVVQFQMETLSKLRANLDVREAHHLQIVEQHTNEKVRVIQMREQENTNKRLVADSYREDVAQRERDHLVDTLCRQELSLGLSSKALEVQWGAIAIQEDAVQMREDEVQRREDKVQRREAIQRSIFGS
jgi:hypothetical protein